jgi:hypothetical protein
VDWIPLAQDKDQWQTVVNTAVYQQIHSSELVDPADEPNMILQASEIAYLQNYTA